MRGRFLLLGRKKEKQCVMEQTEEGSMVQMNATYGQSIMKYLCHGHSLWGGFPYGNLILKFMIMMILFTPLWTPLPAFCVL